MQRINVFKEFLRYAALNVLGMLGLSCYILADTYFVSKGLKTDGLAALNLAIPMYSFIHGSGLMIGMGAGIKYSILKGQDHHCQANQFFTHAIYIVVCLAFVFIGISSFSSTIISMFVEEGQVFDMAKTYLQVILLFSPAFLMNNVLLCFVRNDGAPQLSMTAMLMGSFSNIILDYIFIFPCQMGIFGAVLATGFAPIISMMILSIHFIRHKNQFHIKKDYCNFQIIWDIIKTGFPSLVSEVSSGVVMIIFNVIILRYAGNVGVGAYGIIANISLVVMAIYSGLAQGIQPLMSRDYGCQRMDLVDCVFKYAFIVMMLTSVVIYLTVFLQAGAITRIFNSEHHQTLQIMATHGLKLYFLVCPFAGFNIILSVYLTSVEHPYPAQILSLLRGFVIIIPIVLILSQIAQIDGIWCALTISELITAIIGCCFYLKIQK